MGSSGLSPALLQPALDLIVGEAEMDMGMLALQLDHVVRREVDHQDGAARAHDAGRLGERRRRIVGVVQDVMDGDDIEAVGLERQRIHVALADLDIVEAGAGEVGAGQRQHLAALVDADGLLDLGRQHFEQAAGAGADVEQPARADRQVMGERALDLAIGDVQGPQFVPALGIVAEEAHGGVLAALLQGVEPGAVGGDAGMLGIEPAHELAHQGGVVAGGDQTEAGELALAEALQQAGLDHELEMARHPRLALAQHMDVVADRQVLARRQRQDAQPGVLGRRPEKGEKMIHGSVDISISLCLQALNCDKICDRRTTAAASFGLFTSNCSARVQHCFPNSGGPTPLRAFGPSVSGPAGWTRVVLMVESLPGTMKRKARRSLVAMAIAATLMGGCATGDTGATEVWDPIETPNRFMFSINRVVDIIALRPVAVIYRDWVPEPAQKSVRNLLDNLGEPVTAINEVVQGDPSRAATTMARFLVNSTIGVAGLFDVATMLGLERTKEDAGKTIGLYAGVEPENGGFYLMLPAHRTVQCPRRHRPDDGLPGRSVPHPDLQPGHRLDCSTRRRATA